MSEELNPTSVVAEEKPAASVASPTPHVAKTTEAEIFESLSQPAQEQPATTEETPAEAVIEQPIVEEPEPELDLDVVPEGHDDFSEFKEQIKAAPKLRGIVGRHAAFTEMFPDFAFAKQLHEQFPDQETAEQAVSDASEWQRVSTILTETPEEFPAEYAEANPQGFARMAREFPKLLEQVNKQEWINQRAETVQEILDNAASYAHRDGNQEALSAISLVAQQLGLRIGASQSQPRTDPRDTELTRLRKEKEERTQNELKQSYENFHASILTDCTDSMNGEIEKDVDTVLSKAGVTTDDPRYAATKKRMTKEVFDGTVEKMKEHPDTKRIDAALAASRQAKRFSESEKKSIESLVLNRSRAIRPAVLKQVANEWTKSIIGANQKKIETRQTVAAQTKDVGAGKGAAQPTAPIPPANVPQKRKTERDIFASIGR